MKYYCEKLARHRFRNEKLNINIYEELTVLLDGNDGKDIILIQLLMLSADFLKMLTLKAYEKLNKSFFNNYENINTEQKFIFKCLINGLILLNHPNRLHELFKLQQFGLINNLFIEHETIDEEDYNNIIRVFCKMEKPELAEDFIKTHTQYLDVEPNVLANIQARTTCHIAFAKGDYHTVITNAALINLRRRPYVIDRYIFSFKAHYELGNTDYIHEQKRAFMDYLRDSNSIQQLGNDYKLSYERFHNVLTKIVDYPYEKDYRKEDLIANIKSFNGLIAESKWLLAKIKLL